MDGWGHWRPSSGDLSFIERERTMSEKMKTVVSVGLVALLNACLFGKEINFAPDINGFEGDAGLEHQSLRFAYYPTANRIRVSHGTPRERGRTGRFTIRDSRGSVLFSRSVCGECEWTAVVPDLKTATARSGDGSYWAEFKDDNGSIERIRFHRDVFEWEGNALGTTDAVPDGFEPVQAAEDDGIVLKTVLRDHRLGSLGLPTSIVAAGAETLEMPITLVCVLNGKGEVIEGRNFRFVERKKQYARFAAEIVSANIDGRVEGKWWMDGMLDWRMRIERGAVDSMYLMCRLKKEESVFMHACTDGLRFNHAGKIPDGDGMVWHGDLAPKRAMADNFVPYVWIGGPLRGISVFGENDNGWEPGPEPYQKICRTQTGEAELIVTLVASPIKIRNPRTFRVGFQATPVKPMEKDWRRKKDDVLFGSCWYWGSQTPCNDLLPFDGKDDFLRSLGEMKTTGSTDRGIVDRMVARYRCSPRLNPQDVSNRLAQVRSHFAGGLDRAELAYQQQARTCFYTNGRGLRFGRPEGLTFCDEWYRFKFANRDAFDIDASCAYELDPVPSYLDFAAACWKRMFLTKACDAVYFDDVFLAANFNPETSDAFVDRQGVVHPASGIFNMRAQIMRCAVLQKEMGLPSRGNWIHMTNTAMAPISAFAGVHLDWEDNGKTNPLQERYSRDYIIASTIGRQFGVQAKVLCYFGNGWDDRAPELEEQAVGVLLTHELDWIRGIDRWKEVREKLRSWGYGESKVSVWNYWDKESYPVEITGVETSSLAMKRPDGEAVIIVSSWGNRDAEVVVRQTRGICSKSYAASDFFTEEQFDVRNDAVRIPLKRYSWRALKIVPLKN